MTDFLGTGLELPYTDRWSATHQLNDLEQSSKSKPTPDPRQQ
jgi:hypothetical protein